MQEELRRNIEGDFSDPYVKPDFNEILENRGLTPESEGISENIEPPPENIQDVIENIDYNQAFEGLDSYDFDGINYSDNPERLDASLDSFQSDRWENLSIDEQKDAMNGLAEYVEDIIGLKIRGDSLLQQSGRWRLRYIQRQPYGSQRTYAL